MSSGLCNETKVRNVDCLFQGALVWSVKDRIERNVLQDFVHAELVRIENHGCISGVSKFQQGILCDSDEVTRLEKPNEAKVFRAVRIELCAVEKRLEATKEQRSRQTSCGREENAEMMSARF